MPPDEASQIKVNPYIVACIIILPTVLAMIATSGANACLPYIAGYYGATQNETKAVLTSYMIANAILIPMTGLLMKRLGITKLLNLSIIIFTLGSFICVVAPNLLILIIGRVIQGIGGGSLMPLCQAVLLKVFPIEKRGVAMALFSMAAIVPPLLGPYIGGFLTDNYSWQYSFLVNIPFCFLSLFLNKRFLPYWGAVEEKYNKKFDITGFSLLCIWLISLQIILDKGQQYNWLDNEWICFGTFISIVSMVGFFIWEIEYKYPLINMRVLKNRNFLFGTIIVGIDCIVIYGTMFLIPMFVQGLMGYSATLSGATTLPRIVSAVIGFIIVGKLSTKISNKILLYIGIFVLCVSTALFMNYNLNNSMLFITLPHYLFGFGIALTYSPLSTLAFSTLAIRKIPDAVSLHSLVKALGNAVAIPLAATMIARLTQVNQTYNLDNLTVFNLNFQQKILFIQKVISSKMLMFYAGKKAYGIIYHQLLEQSMLQSFFQTFLFFATFAIIMLPFTYLLKEKIK